MYKIMAVNAGSSSLKFKLFEMPEEKVIAEGIFEKIGLSDPLFKIKYGTIEEKQRVDIKNHQDAVEMLLKVLVDKKIVSKLEEISGVGHRILHCGEFYNDSVLSYRNKIEMFPSNIVASMFGFKASDAVFFETDEKSKEVPQVKF